MQSADAEALWQLIERRTRPDADAAAIDRQIWDRFGGEWAVMFTDLAGFSRQVARFGIVHFLQTIYEQKRTLVPIVERHGGVVIKYEADSLLILFPAAAAALESAVAMQRACRALNAQRSPEEHVVLCVGIGHGRLLRIGDDDVYGLEVNLASKLGEDTAIGREILVTRAARGSIGEFAGVIWEEVEAEYAGESICWRARYEE